MYNWEEVLKFIVKLKSQNTSKNSKAINSLQMIKLSLVQPSYKSLQRKYSIIEEDDLNIDFNSDNRHF